MDLDFDKELELANLLQIMADPETLRESLRRLIRLREIELEKIGLGKMLDAEELAAWSCESESEIRELLNIESQQGR